MLKCNGWDPNTEVEKRGRIPENPEQLIAQESVTRFFICLGSLFQTMVIRAWTMLSTAEVAANVCLPSIVVVRYRIVTFS